MDYPQHITLDLTDTPGRKGWLLHLVAATKNLQIDLATLDSTLKPAAVFRKIQVEGFFPILNYLERILPLTPLYLEDPKRNAIIDSITVALMNARIELSAVASLYASSRTGFLASAPSPTLLDLAIIATSHDSGDNSEWVESLNQTYNRWATAKDLQNPLQIPPAPELDDPFLAFA